MTKRERENTSMSFNTQRGFGYILVLFVLSYFGILETSFLLAEKRFNDLVRDENNRVENKIYQIIIDEAIVKILLDKKNRDKKWNTTLLEEHREILLIIQPLLDSEYNIENDKVIKSLYQYNVLSFLKGVFFSGGFLSRGSENATR